MATKEIKQSVIFFQDIVGGDGKDGCESVDTAESLFEIANAPYAGFRVQRPRHCRRVIQGSRDEHSNDSVEVVVRQDSAVQKHTGGIVWETSYLLATYLIMRYNEISGDNADRDSGKPRRSRPLGRVLEVGAGTGLLGLVLAASGLCRGAVVLTEAEECMRALRANVERNIKGFVTKENCSSDDSGCKDGVSHLHSQWAPCLKPGRAVVRRLRWDKLQSDVKDGGDDLRPGSFDTIFGTDVVFTPELVRPLLDTLATMANANTLVYLCLQERCADSHALLLRAAIEFGFDIEDVTDELRCLPECQWGLELECKLLRLILVGGEESKLKNGIRRDRKTKQDGRKKQKACVGISHEAVREDA